MVITSAFGRESVKKFPDAVCTRSATPGLGDALPRQSARPRADRTTCSACADGAARPGWTAGPSRRRRRTGSVNVEKSNFSAERVEVGARDAGHRAHELLEPRQVGVELLEHRLLAVLDLVLRLAGLERRLRGRSRSGRGGRCSSPGCRRRTRGCSCRGRHASPRCSRSVACGPSPSRSRKPSATSASRKSQMPRGCRPSAAPSSAPVMPRSPSTVNTSSFTAVSRTFELQKPKPVCMIRDGSMGGVMLDSSGAGPSTRSL